MELHTLKATEGSRFSRKRIGRGPGSGTGETAGRGENGQNSRSGGGVRLGFEGGQNPLYRRLPKRGFTNAKFKKEYTIINLDVLNKFNDGDVVTNEILIENKIVKNVKDGIKILGTGSINKKLNIVVDAFSQSAKEQIEKAGGTIEVR